MKCCSSASLNEAVKNGSTLSITCTNSQKITRPASQTNVFLPVADGCNGADPLRISSKFRIFDQISLAQKRIG
jgi:hypothetical protein